MNLTNIATLDLCLEINPSQNLVDVHRYLLMYNGVDQVYDRGQGRLLLQMNIDWDNAPDVLDAWKEAGDKVHQAVLLMESQLKNIKRSYGFDYIPYEKAIPNPQDNAELKR